VLVVGRFLGLSCEFVVPSAHLMLAISLHGFSHSRVVEFKEAALRAASVVLTAAEKATDEDPLSPHCTRVCALAHELASSMSRDGGASRDTLIRQLRLCYMLEQCRHWNRGAKESPATGSAAPEVPKVSRAECLAAVKAITKDEEDALMFKAIANSIGFVPPGSTVRLKDGRVGVVLDSTHVGPLNPVVLGAFGITIPAQPVSLIRQSSSS